MHGGTLPFRFHLLYRELESASVKSGPGGFERRCTVPSRSLSPFFCCSCLLSLARNRRLISNQRVWPLCTFYCACFHTISTPHNPSQRESRIQFTHMTAIASHGKSTSLPFQWQAYIRLKESQRRIKKGSDFGSGGPDDYLIVTPWIKVRFSLHTNPRVFSIPTQLFLSLLPR